MKKGHSVRFIVFSIFFAFSHTLYAANTAHCNKLQKSLNQFRLSSNITGMGLYAHPCYLFSGSIKRGSGERITPHNLFQIGSITKSYFAAILLQLEADSEAGKIPVTFNINQTLKQWLPQYKDWGDVTIKQLLNMTSGIYNYTDLPNFTKMVLDNPKKIWAANEIVQLAYQHKKNTYFPPGKGWHYSDTDYVLAGQVIQKVYQKTTGHIVPLQTILKQRILNKLKLNNTYYYPDGLPEQLATRMVHGYGYYTKKDVTAINLSIAGAAGAIISNPKEIAAWVRAIFDGKILPKKQQKEMLSLVSMKTGQPVAVQDTASDPSYALGLAEQYSKQLGAIWTYMGATFGYTAGYNYSPRYHTLVSYTAGVSSLDKVPPIQFEPFSMDVLRAALPQ